jgi:hypothetical protein
VPAIESVIRAENLKNVLNKTPFGRNKRHEWPWGLGRTPQLRQDC